MVTPFLPFLSFLLNKNCHFLHFPAILTYYISQADSTNYLILLDMSLKINIWQDSRKISHLRPA